VAIGKYTVHVEAIREHGGHSYQAMPLDLTQGPAEAQAAASDELGPAKVRFGPRSPR
jgi:thiamine biosynthesis lipoprotein